MAKILITGFGLFRDHQVNSSWEGVVGLSKRFPRMFSPHKLTVEYAQARLELESIIQAEKPEIALLCGMTSREKFALEKRARKPKEFESIPGDEELTAVWPIKESLEEFQKRGIDCELSSDAGQYVCESTYWAGLRFRKSHEHPNQICFLHVPALGENWELSKIISGIEAALTPIVKLS